MLRFLARAFAALLAGGFTGLVLLVGYVIGKLWLAGHNAEPAWYDDVAAAVVFGGAIVAAVLAYRTVPRRRR